MTGRDRERARLSRAVAATALRRKTGLDRESCAKADIDGFVERLNRFTD